MMVIPASGAAGVAAVKSFKRKWRLVLKGEKEQQGREWLLENSPMDCNYESGSKMHRKKEKPL